MKKNHLSHDSFSFKVAKKVWIYLVIAAQDCLIVSL